MSKSRRVSLPRRTRTPSASDPGTPAVWQVAGALNGGISDILKSITDGFLILHRDWRFRLVNRSAERLLRKPREQLLCQLRFQASLLDAVGQAVIACDPDGLIGYWNGAAEALFGWSAAEVLGSSILETAAAAEPGDRARHVLRELAAGRSWSGEFTGRRKDGHCVPIVLSLRPLLDVAGRAIGSVAVCTDITAQKRAERHQRLLAEAGAFLAASLQSEAALLDVVRLAIPDLADWCFVDLLEEDGRVRRTATAHRDPHMEALCGELMRYPPAPDGRNITSRVLRTGRSWLQPDVPDAGLAALSHHPEHLRILRALQLLSGIAVPLVARGRTIGVLRMATTASSGRRFGADDLGTAEELARRLAFAIDNARLYEAAQRAIAERERVLRVVSHDLRNPLGAIFAHTDLLRLASESGSGEEFDPRWIEMIDRAATQMNHLIRDLLDFASIETGRLALHPQRCGAGSLAAEAVEMHHPLAASRSLELTLEASASAPAVYADRERISQVLSNLLDNAIRLTPPGGAVRVRVEAARDSARFSVADTGPGIEDEHLAHIFRPFWRPHPGERSGTGLGLAIARALVESHGGRLHVESRAGAGSTFHFTLPRFRPEMLPGEGRERHEA